MQRYKLRRNWARPWNRSKKDAMGIKLFIIGTMKRIPVTVLSPASTDSIAKSIAE
jgi:hypothetical protein